MNIGNYDLKTPAREGLKDIDNDKGPWRKKARG